MTDTAETQSTFDLILETTEQLIREKGCRHTTLQDIINRSGLSKGAIYHYVSGKDELLGRILKARVEQMNNQFYAVAKSPENQGVEHPLKLIAGAVAKYTDPNEVTSKIFIYLLSQTDNSKVTGLLQEVYQYTADTCRRWIEFGQQSGVIPASVQAESMALAFITFMYGMRVQHAILKEPGKLGFEDMFRVMLRSLQ